MSHPRATLRLTALCAVTCAAAISLVAGLVLTSLSGRARTAWRGFVFQRWAKALVALLNIHVRTIGSPPRAPFFLVANHLSYVDVVVLASQVECSFIAKADVSRWPAIGWLCRGVGTIFIDRNNRRDLIRVSAQVERALAAGRGVVLFPEGTSSPGANVLPFKPGLLESAARADFAVSHAALSYRVPAHERPAHLSVCWWGEMTFIGHLAGLLRVSEIDATLVFGRETVRGRERKALAHQLHVAVCREFIPVVSSEEEWSAEIR